MGFVTNLRERFADALEDKRDSAQRGMAKAGTYIGAGLGFAGAFYMGSGLLTAVLAASAGTVGAIYYGDKALDKVIDGVQWVLRP